MIIRLFDTCIDPEDVDRSKLLFRRDVRPAFERFAGCSGIELYIGVEERGGDLTDLCAISRWDSLDDIEAALSSDDYRAALAELRTLFQKSPIVRHFEVAD